MLLRFLFSDNQSSEPNDLPRAPPPHRSAAQRYEMIPYLFRRSNLATSPASVHRVASIPLSLRGLMAPGKLRWWPSELARRFSALFGAATAPTFRVYRFPQNVGCRVGVKHEKWGKLDIRPIKTSANNFTVSLVNITKGMKSIENIYTTKKFITQCCHGLPSSGADNERRASGDTISDDEYACRKTLEIIDIKPDTAGEIMDIVGCETWTAEMPYSMGKMGYMDLLPCSSHRDGSIYRDTHSWKRDYRTADRSETRLEAMMFSNPTDCIIRQGICIKHTSMNMLQFFSLRLAEIPADHGSVELYGYIATRDLLEPLLNYVVNFSRDDPIVVEQGSLINMTGPKRGIRMVDTTLIEFDMKIKIGKHEHDDLQLIDGVSTIDDMETWNCSPFKCRIHGDCGAIDLVGSRLNDAVEATVHVVLSNVEDSFSMCLVCFTSGIHEEIQLFDGAIGESGGLKRSVVAVMLGAQMDLKFKVAANSCIPADHFCCSFKANQHGHATQEIKTNFALITVNVTWSALG